MSSSSQTVFETEQVNQTVRSATVSPDFTGETVFEFTGTKDDGDIEFVAVHRKSGRGKTLASVGLGIMAAKFYGLPLVANLTLDSVYSNFGVQTRKIVSVPDFLHSESSALLWDEADKSVPGRGYESNWNQLMVRLTGDLRHNKNRFVVLNCQYGKTGVDVLVRNNVSRVIEPTHECVEVNGKLYPTVLVFQSYPDYLQYDQQLYSTKQANWQNFAVKRRLSIPLDELKPLYDTFEKIPLQFSVPLTEAEENEFAERYLNWCKKKRILWDASQKVIDLSIPTNRLHLNRWLRHRRDSGEERILFVSGGDIDTLVSVIHGIGEQQRQKIDPKGKKVICKECAEFYSVKAWEVHRVESGHTQLESQTTEFLCKECGKEFNWKNWERHQKKTGHSKLEPESEKQVIVEEEAQEPKEGSA